MAPARNALVAGLGPALLLLGALIPELRLPAAGLVVVGYGVLLAARRDEAIAWAAVLPVALVLPWPQVLGADMPLGEAACIQPASTIVVRRLLVAAVGLALVAALAKIHSSSPAELGLRMPGRREAAGALGAGLAIALGGLYLGPAIAAPFFGRLDFPVPPAALLPAVVFGIANGVLEEIQYRGAMQAWLGRLTGPWVAIAVQGLVFGVVHAGPEVVALLPVHIAMMGAAGVGAGLLRRWTGSLWLPIGVHVGADIALYVGLACRAAA